MLSFSVLASEPQTIELKTKSVRTIAWYDEQATAWSQKLNNANANIAWINYYMAARYAQWETARMDEIQQRIAKQLPGSFAHNIIAGWNHGYNSEAIQFLKQASLTDESHPVLSYLLTLQHEFNLLDEDRKQSSRALFDAGAVSQSLLSYSYNVLMSVDQNAMLITEGENTMLPLLVLQDVFGIRKDVNVLNLDLLLNDDYRKRKFDALSLSSPETISKISLCELLPGLNSQAKFYFALTIDQQNVLPIKDQLYVVGLASRVTSERMDNISIIKDNLEKKFLLDYLTVNFNGEPATATGNVFRANYLVPMLLLTEHYQQTGQLENATRWNAIIKLLADQTGKTQLVANFMNRQSNERPPFVRANLDIKRIEGMLRQLKDNIYASEYEVTNLEYNAYLRYLESNKMMDEYEISKIDLSGFDDASLALMKNYHADVTPTKKQQFFTAYPVMNIPYEGAIAYCNWLTEQYNASPEKKYNKVKFRLPSINEWQIAALGYKDFQSWNINENIIEVQIPKTSEDVLCAKCPVEKVKFNESDIRYPWYKAYNFRNRAVNNKGCALGNFKWQDDQTGCKPNQPILDGFVLTSPVGAYFPNNIGLYDVVGNVAEMVNEKGTACGGSWNHPAEESTITSINKFDGPDAAIGFRVFMEIVEQ